MENTEQKSILEENEIMRLSLRKSESEEDGYILSLERNGPGEPMVQALMEACRQFDLVCLPAGVLGGIPAIAAICCVGRNPFAQPEEGDGTEEGPGNKEE